MNNRIRKVRSYFGFNQKEFSQKINIGSSTLAMLETGQRAIKDIHISQICSVFNVNEHWLRTGEGEMFEENDDTIISELVKEYQLDDLDKKILEHYLQLSEEDRKAIKNYVFSLSKHMIEQPETTASTMEPTLEQILEEDVEKYRQERLAELKGETKSSVSDAVVKKSQLKRKIL